jgi:hypothetical protein
MPSHKGFLGPVSAAHLLLETPPKARLGSDTFNKWTTTFRCTLFTVLVIILGVPGSTELCVAQTKSTHAHLAGDGF